MYFGPPTPTDLTTFEEDWSTEKSQNQMVATKWCIRFNAKYKNQLTFQCLYWKENQLTNIKKSTAPYLITSR